MTFALKKGERLDQRQLIADLVALPVQATPRRFSRGTFRVRGEVSDIFRRTMKTALARELSATPWKNMRVRSANRATSRRA